MQEHTEDARTAIVYLSVKIAVYASMAAFSMLQSHLALYHYWMIIIVSLQERLLTLLQPLATGIDSIFDIRIYGVLWYLHCKSRRLNVNKWPVGGARLENIGIWFSEDHWNGIFLNGFGVLMSARGSKLRWCKFSLSRSNHRRKLTHYLGTYRADPTGALIIGVGILLTWGRTIYREFELLAGKSAPNELLTYNAMTFSDEIEKVDTVRAYHSGSQYFVEVDIVMKDDTPLWKAYDASQLLQDLMEALPNVERAFVHVDHEATHMPVSASPFILFLAILLVRDGATVFDLQLNSGTFCFL
ncbi:hypothetical protein GYMLUDRAFT_257508 [Collybiopsis luxurians FD-317 M1]|nr:hypothetical protein GYMLUDRAFT_257508 [Collybiopsis luxurians FD-317 M1]